MTEDRIRIRSHSADKPFVPPGGMMTRVGMNYILHKEERRIEPVDCRSHAGLMRWAQWFEGRHDRIVDRTDIEGCTVSTVFLGLDHSYGNGPAILFETMVFPDRELPKDEGRWIESYQERYATLTDAEQGHAAVVVMIREQASQAEHIAARIIERLKELR
jgi:hypothetical protein